MADGTVKVSSRTLSLSIDAIVTRLNARVADIGQTIGDGYRADVQAAATLGELQVAIDPVLQEVVDLALDLASVATWIHAIAGDSSQAVTDPAPGTACGAPGFECP